jgi:feruloyl esterase
MTKRQTLMLGGAAVSLLAATAITACVQNGGAGAALDAPRVATAGAPAAPCETLAQTAFPDATVTLAEEQAAGPFTPPGGGGDFGAGPVELPAFCRVAATLSPSSDSNIKMEVWLPADWNGKFMMVGNGVWSGAVSYFAMAEPLNRGYAVASTDTGHEGGRGTFAFEHPEWLVDFAWRAVHETAVKGKALTAAYYGREADLSYWNGCSSGGKQGLKEAQNFPEDFDAMITGAPANNWVRLEAQSLVAGAANLPVGEAPLLGPPQFSLLHDAAIEQCDALDGVQDGEIADARRCSVDPESLVCEAGQDAATCLTPRQADAAAAIYAPVRNPSTNELIYPGMPPGSELLWPVIVMQPFLVGVDTFAVLLDDPNWDFRMLDLSTDVDAAEAADPGIVATNPDLSAFAARGGKIIQYHGWTDALIPSENSINYYESVVAAQGGLEKTQDFYRLFMVPGMGHCSGAYGVDWIGELERWVEGGETPDTVLGQRLPAAAFGAPPAPAQDLGARPICAYPNVAVYSGSGSDSDPASFTCQVAERGARQSHRP